MTATPDLSPPTDRLSPRLFTDEALGAGSSVTLAEAQAHYIRHVLRLQTGAMLRLFNGRDGEWRATVTEMGKKSIAIAAQERLREQVAPPALTLCAAPIKKAHFDYMIEKATELGIAALQPVLTERTQIREVNADRARLIAIEAAEQSERLDVPEIRGALRLPELAAQWPQDVQPIICAEWGEAQPVHEAFGKLSATKAALFTGPEGGFTGSELDLLRQLPNAVFIRLGSRILRADTAAIAALSCWQAIRGDWR